ncbi:tRNA pseudouridine(65) synthase TruC [Motilimonas cestriensis]|uniref:tRNA pseudouridine(65) synthase TruC n=2 Tax=Motilimonas TaxID=1914248 RepID=UPI003DA42B8B
MSQALSLFPLLAQLKQSMQQAQLWQADIPSDEALASQAPFCVDTLTFAQWLQFVFHPKLSLMAEQQMPLPSKIAVLPMAEEAFKLETKPTDEVMRIISQIDTLLTQDEPVSLLDIVYQDEYLVAINKPSGLLVHRSWLDKGATQFAMQMLRDQLGQYVYPIHRLDRPTSGVLLFALSSDVARLMSEQFAERAPTKMYYALVRGWCGDGELDYPLKEELDKIADKHASQAATFKEAVTQYQCLQQVELPFAVGRYATARFSLMQLMPKTGRKHQLRRHLAHLRHPIIGDTSHGDGKQNAFSKQQLNNHRLLLHAAQLAFTHPITQHATVIDAPLPADFERVLKTCGIDRFSV